MGRTQRKRNQKQPHNFHTCNNQKDLILLNSWLSEQGISCSKKLVLAVFNETGRGVLTKKKIAAGEELMNLPLNLTINVINLLTDNVFCSIFMDSNICLVDYKGSIPFQCLLAFYILFLKSQGLNSKWYVYLDSLPKNYTVPYYLPTDIQSCLYNDILSVITNQKQNIEKSYNIFKHILINTNSKYPTVTYLKEYFCMSNYEWAYFTVNTRCVYMDLTNIIDLKNMNSTILALINDNTKISLCPYLDMLNHNPHTINETKLIISKDLKIIPLSKLDKDIFSHVRFSIYTKVNFEAYTEVYICYGDSHNLKLITEYGFYLPHNDMDGVVFGFDEVIVAFNSNGVVLSSDQMCFIENHGLNKDLYIDFKGLSFNFYGLLMVAKYYYKTDVNVSKLMYTAAVCADDRVLIDFIKPKVQSKLEELIRLRNKLQAFRQCAILENCIKLMCHYVCMLEKFIEC